MILLILALLVTLIVIYIVQYYYNVRRYPKGPVPLPFVGNLFQVDFSNFHNYMHQLSKKYGTIYTLFLPAPTVVITDFESLKEALLMKGEHFTGKQKGPNLLTKVPNGGIFFSDGENWREQRRLALTILRDFGMGKGIMEERIMTSVQDMLHYLEALENKEKVDMHLPIQLCVGNVINRILFGYEYEPDNADQLFRNVQIITDVTKEFSNPALFIVSTWPITESFPVIGPAYRAVGDRLKPYFNFVAAEVAAQVESFQANTPATSFFHAYLQEMNSSKSPFLNLDQLENVISDFWIAGMETTTITLRWAILYMIAYPEIQSKAQLEIDQIVGKDRSISMADKVNMPYCSALLNEVQRFANILTAEQHVSTSDQTISGVFIPAGTAVFTQYCSVMAHDPIFEEPEKFIPGRFLSENRQSMRKDLLERLVPFGMGKRACPGEGLAKMQMFLLLTTLLQHYRFTAIGPVNVEPISGILVLPHDYECKIEKRA